MKTLKMALLVFSLGAANIASACVIKKSNGSEAAVQADAFYQIIKALPACPENVQALQTTLKNTDNVLKPSMVANRGINNPSFGSFSLFEQVLSHSLANPKIEEGELFFGHFTDLVQGSIVLDQTPAPGKLLIELIAWDKQKELFNFYELIGTATGGQWFYRGDSADIIKDNANLYLDVPTGQNKFGTTLRCSACHTSGGPIMKELSAPHNDWWVNSQPLKFGSNKLSNEVATVVAKLAGADEFSHAVKKGIQKLENSANYQKIKSQQSLQVQLRPLFCETEINLESDLTPLDVGVLNVNVPSASVINPLLMQSSLTIKKLDYLALLDKYRMNFPETKNKDADHAWLVPVKGYSDLIAIQSLMQKGIIDEEFMTDVLAIDLENPLFSHKRCGLVKLIPKTGGLEAFKNILKLSNLPEAQELYQNLTDPAKNQTFHKDQAQKIFAQTQLQLSTFQEQSLQFESLILKRQAVFDSEISKNPRGQILEPGFRVIFAAPQN
ncbi:MAG: hypothetical protein V4654_11995 [Bdellovibrionota bacterium]